MALYLMKYQTKESRILQRRLRQGLVWLKMESGLELVRRMRPWFILTGIMSIGATILPRFFLVRHRFGGQKVTPAVLQMIIQPLLALRKLVPGPIMRGRIPGRTGKTTGLPLKFMRTQRYLWRMDMQKGGRTMTAHGKMIRRIPYQMETAARRRAEKIYTIKSSKQAISYKSPTMGSRRTGQRRASGYMTRLCLQSYGRATVRWKEPMRA